MIEEKEHFLCKSCGVISEKWFDWAGNCLNCEEDEEKSFDDECDCMEDICVCLYPFNQQGK